MLTYTPVECAPKARVRTWLAPGSAASNTHVCHCADVSRATTGRRRVEGNERFRRTSHRGGPFSRAMRSCGRPRSVRPVEGSRGSSRRRLCRWAAEAHLQSRRAARHTCSPRDWASWGGCRSCRSFVLVLWQWSRRWTRRGEHVDAMAC